MEYQILKAPLCQKDTKQHNSIEISPIKINTTPINLSKEIEFNCVIQIPNNTAIKTTLKRKLGRFILNRKRTRRVINQPTTSKATRSITFDDYDRNKETHAPKIASVKPVTQLDCYEMGDEGVLCETYSNYLPAWLEFGSTIMAPSVRKQKIHLTNSHLPATTVKELLNFIQDTPKAFRSIPSHALTEENEVYVPYDSNSFVQKCVVISRNFDNWKASSDPNAASEGQDFLSPHILKHSQKFVPATVNNRFIPRQKILWILVESDSVFI